MTNSDYGGNKLWIATGNFWYDRQGYSPKWVILHGTAGGTRAVDTANYLNNVGLSVHYIIGKAGEIVQMVHESDAAWGNGILDPGHDSWWSESLNPNLVTISIEHDKESTSNADALTPQQKKSSFTLVRDICTRNGIPQRLGDSRGGILPHKSLQPINRHDCPGNYPWDELFAYLDGNGSRSKVVNKYGKDEKITKEFDGRWDSLAHLFPNSVPPPRGTGIFKSWTDAWSNNIQFGPPLSFEFTQINNAGRKVNVQIFTDGQCEWDDQDGKARWFSTGGEVNW